MEIVFTVFFLVGVGLLLYVLAKQAKLERDELKEYRSRLLESLNRIGDILDKNM